MSRVDGTPLDPKLRLAIALAAIEVTAVIGALLASRRHPPLLLLALAFKYVLCRGAARRGAGSVLGLLLWEGTTAIALVGATGVVTWARVTGIAVALGIGALLLASAGDLPAPTLPQR